MNEEYGVKNLPNAYKIINSLRSVGYDNISAIADLVDNSIDAGADKIQVQVKPDMRDFTIHIADNGCGMTKEVLDEALKLGSDTQRDQEADLGKFGMGLITASLSFCRKLTVITKTEEDGMLTSIQDVDVIKERNDFVKELRETSDEEKLIFESFLPNVDSGTLLILSKCDQIQDKNIDNLIKKLRSAIGQIFRLFIDSGREITISNEKVKALDPLMLSDDDTKIISEDTFPVKTDSGTEETIKVRMVMLPDISDTDTGKVNIPNQGFYLMRNNREIAEALTLGTFNKHNDFNRFRGEIYFSGNLDDEMRIEFTKRDLRPKEDILKELKKIAVQQLRYFRKEIKRDQVRHRDKEEVHEASAKSIKEKSPLLIKPDVKIEKRGPRKNKGKDRNQTDDSKNARRPQKIQDLRNGSRDVEFEVRELGENGILFDVDQIGRTTQITYNSEHPFYQKVFIENENEPIKNYIDFMIYSLSTAKLKTFDEEQYEQINNYITVFSSNLRVLTR